MFFRLNKNFVILAVASVSFGFSGCTSNGSGPYGSIGAGSAAGGGIGYALSDGDAAVTGASAVVGGLFGNWFHTKNQKIAKQNFDTGYKQGASDAIKRHYWSKQSMHKKDSETKHTYYELPGIESLSDGTKRVPHSVVIEERD